MKTVVKNIKKTYRKTLRKHKGTIKSLKWNSYVSAATRYRELVGDLDFGGKLILDVGCGFGDIIPFIAGKNVSFKYTGIDLMKEFVQESRKRYPDYEFVEGNYFKKPLPRKFDIIICCGALNGNYGEGTLEYRKQSIKTMFNHSKEAVAFNMAGGMTPINRENSTIYYANSMDILKYCTTLSRKVILRNHYHTKDFTIFIFK